MSGGGHGSTLGAHLHLGHVFRLLHELDRLRQRICGGGKGTSEVRGRFEGGDGPPIGAAFWRDETAGRPMTGWRLAMTTREEATREVAFQ